MPFLFGLATPTQATIPVTSLANGNYPANNWTGFTTTATSVTSHVMTPNPNNQQIFATGNGVWRDQEISTYMGGRGTLYLRLGVDGQAIFCSLNLVGGNSLKIGIVQNFVATAGIDNGATGNFYDYYINSDPAATLSGYGVPGSVYTFGTAGFEIYLKINGVKVVSYTEWRLCRAGQMAVWAQSGVSQDIVAAYLQLRFLYSNPYEQIYDPRDFGMRAVVTTTGSMAAGSNQLTGVTTGLFQIGDPIVVEIGGESGGGLRSSVGVGGQWPALSYADLTTMNADTGKANGTFAYLLTNNFVYSSTSGVWSRDTGGGGVYNQGYYTDLIVPLSLVANVTAISANGRTLTLDQTATVATTAANIWLDCKPSFFLINQSAPVGASVAPNPSGAITLSIPSGDWRLSDIVKVSASAPSGFAVPQNGFTVKGAGKALTTLYSPKGITCGAINLTGVGSNTVMSDMKYIGNLADNGFLFQIGGATTNGYGGYPSAFNLNVTGGTAITGLVLRNIDCVNAMGQACGIVAGTGPLIDTCSSTMQNGQRQYMGWQIQLVNCTAGSITDCITTGAYLLKSFELFACNGSSTVRCSGANALMATNSSTSCTLDTPSSTIAANSFFDQLSGAIDEPVISINNNAFGSGNTITVTNPRIIQSGYIDASNNSLKAIHVLHTNITDVTISGQYPGAGGCSTTLGGLIQAPDYNAGSAEYGSMGVYSDAARTIVTGIRIKGTAIGTPGHSGHFGNVSLLGSSSQVTNCVADAIQTGPTLSGNQTNTAYGGC